MLKSIWLICFFIISFFVEGFCQQANLVITAGSLLTTNVSRGSYLKCTFKVKNIGTATAGKSHTQIYISATPSLTNAILLSDISCEPLAINQETAEINYIYPLPYNITNGNRYVLMSIDARNEVTESNEANDFYITTPFIVNASIGKEQNLPYPIILIHGLNSDYHTWDSLKTNLQNYYGWSYGGNMNFCLNQDGNLATANKTIDYKDWTDTSSLSIADFYTVNFNVGVNGQDVSATNPTVQSNQAAIVKQALAVRDAIKHVLKLTERDKVVLAVHSMGGLASREYLQNSINWQADGKHHVAKLATMGTPHGGSNSSAWGFSGLVGIDEHSEAVRDLRYDYFYSGNPGVYLFGGRESNSYMSNFLFSNYNNIDVNCNGIIDAANVQGLNQKNIPNDLSYSCVIGDGSSLGGDGVVAASRANINTYYNLAADTFVSIAQATVWHTELQKLANFALQGLDESKAINLAYQLDTGRFYFGNFSTQSKATAIATDSDYYKFPLYENGELSIQLLNIPVANAGIKIYNETGSLIIHNPSNNKGDFVSNMVPVSAGVHFANVYGSPDADAWYFPYATKVNYIGLGICPGNNIIFNAGLSGNAYQWQVDTGQGFNNLINNTFYTGATTANLQLTAPPTGWYGYKYRCLVNGNIIPGEKVLKFSARWTGALNTSWEEPANWNCGILPDEKTDVLIYSGVPNYPTVNTVVFCRSIKLNSGASLLIKTAAGITLTGN